MRYLTIAPNYTGSCIQDDFSGPIDLSELNLPQDFINEITAWHLKYRSIIPLSDEDRKVVISEIKILDIQGLILAEKLRKIIPGGAKVRYFSEGLLKYLPTHDLKNDSIEW